MIGKTHALGGSAFALGSYIVLREVGVLNPNLDSAAQLLCIMPYAMWSATAPDFDQDNKDRAMASPINLAIQQFFNLIGAGHRSLKSHVYPALIATVLSALSIAGTNIFGTSNNNSTVVYCMVILGMSMGLAITLTQEKEDVVNQQDSDLIDMYHQQEKADYLKDKNSKILVYDVKDEKGDTVSYTGKNIDCILHLDSIGVSVPVMRGNTDRDLELYRTVVANDKMELFSTVYGIMGHHARDMSVSLGGIDKLKVGDKLRLEKGQQIVDYEVVQSVAKYADSCDFLFNPVYGTTVYLFTCDYTLAGSKVAYRVVKCEPVKEITVEKNGKKPVSGVRSTEND